MRRKTIHNVVDLVGILAVLGTLVILFTSCKLLSYCEKNPELCIIATPTPVPTVAPTATQTQAPSPSPTNVVVAFNPPPPPINMTTSGAPITDGRMEITQHYPTNLPNIPSPLVRDEYPSTDPSFINPQGAKNCDQDHFYDPMGNPTIMWWVCGGSVKYNTKPRDYDIAQPFVITCTGSAQVIKYPARDNFEAIVSGSGSCSACVPFGATTKDGIAMPIYQRCGTWPVQ